MLTAGNQPHPLAPAAPAISIPYETLHVATGGFSPLAHSQGGHKLGEGGSGEVFHCELSLEGGRPQDVAVKVFRSGTGEVSCLAWPAAVLSISLAAGGPWLPRLQPQAVPD